MSSKPNKPYSLIQSGLNLIPQAISIFDEDLNLQIWNTSFVELFSFPDHLVFQGSSFEDIIMFLAKRGEYGTGDVEEIVREKVNQALTFVPHYFERPRPNGTIISVEGCPLSEGGWISVYTDITQYKRQEAFLLENRDMLSDKLLQHSGKLAEANRELMAANRALAELKRIQYISEQRMRLITQSIPAHIAYITPEYEYTYSNNRFSDIIGIKYPNIVGKKMFEVFGEPLFKKIKPFVSKALSGETAVVEFETTIDRDERRIIRATFKPDFDDQDTVLGVFILSLDITEEVRTMEALLLSKRVESSAQLISGLAHDFGNILTIIKGNLSRIEAEDLKSETKKTLINNTKKAASRAVRIIDNLTTFTGKQNLNPRIVNISELLSEITRIFRNSLPKNITLKIDLPEEDIFSFVDESALQDVLINLLLNAKDATGENGCVTISSKYISAQNPLDTAVQITVKDNGSGFNEETLKKAFEPFYTSKRNQGGSGLGLSMAHGFVKQSNGQIELRNNIEAGASVILKLPVPQNKNQVALNSLQILKKETQHEIVLVIDDEAEVRQAVRNILQSLGYAVIECTNSAEALHIVKEIDGLKLIISDVIMPGDITGVDLCDKILSYNPNIAILLMTGLPNDHNILYGVKERFTIISKPVSDNKMRNALKSVKF